MNKAIRPAAVAGLFYPASPRALGATVDALLADARTRVRAVGEVKALIVPHAAYQYSGPVAAAAYCLLEPLAPQIRRVVLLGPAHRVLVHGQAVPRAAAFATPLGEVAIDRESIERIAFLPDLCFDDEAHREEHSLEVQLPFLQRLLPSFRLVPIAIGITTAAAVAQTLEALWGGRETLIVASSDLSHYHDYATAVQFDRSTTNAIESLAAERIGPEDACGGIAVRALLMAARRRGLHATTMDLRNSGDTAGPRDRVVGYGSYSLQPPDR